MNTSVRILNAKDETKYDNEYVRQELRKYKKQKGKSNKDITNELKIASNKFANFLNEHEELLSADSILKICDKLGLDYTKALNLKDSLYDEYKKEIRKINRIQCSSEEEKYYSTSNLGCTKIKEVEKLLKDSADELIEKYIINNIGFKSEKTSEELEEQLSTQLNKALYSFINTYFNKECLRKNQNEAKSNDYNREYVKKILLAPRYKNLYYEIKKDIHIGELSADDIIYCCYKLNEAEIKKTGRGIISVKVALNRFDTVEEKKEFKKITDLRILKYLSST